MAQPGLVLYQRILDLGVAAFDDEVKAWVTETFRHNERVGGDGAMLLRCMGLPTTPIKRQQEIRNLWLARAASTLPEFHRATLLRGEALAFDRRKWPCWCDLPSPPHWATPIEACLFWARRAREFPEDRKQYERIIAVAFSPENVHGDPPSSLHGNLSATMGDQP